jgi:hypothetical protein
MTGATITITCLCRILKFQTRRWQAPALLIFMSIFPLKWQLFSHLLTDLQNAKWFHIELVTKCKMISYRARHPAQFVAKIFQLWLKVKKLWRFKVSKIVEKLHFCNIFKDMVFENQVSSCHAARNGANVEMLGRRVQMLGGGSQKCSTPNISKTRWGRVIRFEVYGSAQHDPPLCQTWKTLNLRFASKMVLNFAVIPQ